MPPRSSPHLAASAIRSRVDPPRITGAFAAACLAGALLASAAAAEDVWIGPVGGNSGFSNPANWLDGTAPLANDPTLALRFATRSLGTATATNDLGPLMLERLTLAQRNSTSFTIAGDALRFSDDAPEISLDAVTDTAITAPVVLASVGPTLTFTGSGAGGVTTNGISESGGAHSLLINATPPSPDLQLITLAGTNTFTGGITLTSGNLRVLSSMGGGALTVNGGTLRLGAGTFFNPVRLNADLLIASPGIPRSGASSRASFPAPASPSATARARCG